MSSFKLSKRERILLIIAAVAIFAVLYYGLLVSPLNHELRQMRSSIANTQNVLLRYRALIQDENRILSDYKAFAFKMENSRPYVSAVDMMDDMQKLSKGLLEFKSIRPIETNLSSVEKNRFAVEFDCVSEFESILKFLFRLETEREYLSVKRLDLNLSSSESGLINAHFYIDNGAE